MRCPICGGRTRVLETNANKRRRKCLNEKCEHRKIYGVAYRFNTVETQKNAGDAPTCTA